jgi:predicted nucleic acid-binding protein
MIAVDTNVLIGAIQTFDQSTQRAARGSVKSLYRAGEALFCFPQNLIEFWSASTRTANSNGLGFSPEQAARHLDRFQRIFRVLPDTPEIFLAWRKLALRYRVSGIKVHDTRIVAAMTVHRVSKILTFDLEDFKRYENITVLHPSSF